MSTIPSSHDDFVDTMIYGKQAFGVIFDDIFNDLRKEAMSYKFDDYEMVRLDTKHYGFVLKTGGRITNDYRCSHINAIKRFKLHLIAQRILG